MEILKTISVAGIISFLITLFSKEHDKYIKSKDEYFNSFLMIFYDKYKESKDFDVKKFYLENCSRSNSYIPPYVHFLIDKTDYKSLQRILIVDYYDLYPNYKNTILKTMTYFINIIDLLYCLFMILLIALIAAMILIILGMIGFMNSNISLQYFVILSLCTIIFFVMFKVSAFYLDKNDIYSLNKDRIVEIIDSKQKRYYKIIEKMYL